MTGVNYYVSTRFLDERENKTKIFGTISEALVFLSSEGFDQIEIHASSNGSDAYFVHKDNNYYSAHLIETILPLDYMQKEERT